MRLCETKNNHFVPQFYLRKFLNVSGNLQIFDKTRKNMYCTRDLRGIACSRNLYTITQKITQNDINFFKKLSNIQKERSPENEYIFILTCFLNDELSNLISVKCNNEENKHFVENMVKDILNESVSRNQEILLSFYENDFQRIYSKIINENGIYSFLKTDEDPFVYISLKTIDFIYFQVLKKMNMYLKKKFGKQVACEKQNVSEMLNKIDYYDFVYYVLIQYFRTENIIKLLGLKENIYDSLKLIEEKYKININNIMFLILHFKTIVVFSSLINDGYRLFLIKNDTDYGFITSDNPVINTYADIIKNRPLRHGEFEIYFPLTPKIAVLYSKNVLDKDCPSNAQAWEITNTDKIYYWNNLILRRSDRYVYASSKEDIEKTIKMAKHLLF